MSSIKTGEQRPSSWVGVFVVDMHWASTRKSWKSKDFTWNMSYVIESKKNVILWWKSDISITTTTQVIDFEISQFVGILGKETYYRL